MKTKIKFNAHLTASLFFQVLIFVVIMSIVFYKYQGTGNDFIIIDNRQNEFDKKSAKFISQLCERRFGIGADGLILLEHCDTTDFKMVYYNSDGRESSMCGNGGRCIVAFAHFLKMIENHCTFIAIDGIHKAEISEGIVKLQMKDVDVVNIEQSYTFLDTGSPHHVTMVDNVSHCDVQNLGREIRYGEPYGEEGTNVNFVEQLSNDTFKVRTYERGVEGETYSCGTGVTAVAIAMHANNKADKEEINIKTQGGNLKIDFEVRDGKYKNIWLTGPAVQLFKGEL